MGIYVEGMTKNAIFRLKFLNIKSLAWVTDPHFEFLEESQAEEFCARLRASVAEGILITGDISNGPEIRRAFTMLSKTVRKPIFFTLGNHDRYESSFARTEAIVDACVRHLPYLYRLTGREVLRLAPGHALVGVDGWADGRAGNGSNTQVRINDFVQIYDFQVLRDDAARFELMQKLAREYAEAVRASLEKAMSMFSHVWLATHVPPFVEATWHEGKLSEPDFLPFFCWPTLGEILTAVSQRHPRSTIRVLCGHTHGKGRYSRDNIVVDTGEATYGQPRINEIVRF